MFSDKSLARTRRANFKRRFASKVSLCGVFKLDSVSDERFVRRTVAVQVCMRSVPVSHPARTRYIRKVVVSSHIENSVHDTTRRLVWFVHDQGAGGSPVRRNAGSAHSHRSAQVHSTPPSLGRDPAPCMRLRIKRLFCLRIDKTLDAMGTTNLPPSRSSGT